MSESDLTAKQERALVALMGARTLDVAAARAEVGQRTLRRWLQQDAFQAAFRRLRRDAMGALTQLYFDRQRVLAEASSLPPDDPRRAALALRASELAARLDGGSGGWFSAQRFVAVPPSGIPARPR